MAYYYSPFRKTYGGKAADGCPFCNKAVIGAQKIAANKHWYWVVNSFPKFEGHTMLVPKRHLTHIGDETTEETLARQKVLIKATSVLKKAYPKAGFEVFLQTGSGSESSVPHLHWHVVPASPTDPLRSFDKLGQFYTVNPREERVLIFPIKIKRSPKQLLAFLTAQANTKRR